MCFVRLLFCEKTLLQKGHDTGDRFGFFFAGFACASDSWESLKPAFVTAGWVGCRIPNAGADEGEKEGGGGEGEREGKEEEDEDEEEETLAEATTLCGGFSILPFVARPTTGGPEATAVLLFNTVS